MAGRAVVIGAGAIGVAAAYSLQRSGWAVTLVDRADVGKGCSYGNACLIVPSHSDPLPAPGVVLQALRWMLRPDSPFYIRPRFDPGLMAWSLRFLRYCNRAAAARGYAALLGLSRASLAMFDELTGTGEARFFFERRGLLEVFFDTAGEAGARRAREHQLAAGFDSRLLSAEQARDLEPALADTVRGGLFVEGEAHGSSYDYVVALAASARRHGVAELTGRNVSRILVGEGRVRGVALENPAEDLPADLVVLAAGAWSGFLARSLGVRIPLQPAKGYSATFDAYDGGPRVPILVGASRVIVTPLDERLRFGGTLELSGFDDSIDRVRYGAVVRAGRSALGAVPELRNEQAWCGFRPITPDGLPIIDRVPGVEGLIVATGHAMLGFTQSPMTGRLVAELANGEAPSLPLAPFRLDRF